MTRAAENIWVYGVGGVGGYFGGRMVHALRLKGRVDAKIFFVGRGPHLDAIRKQGLLLNTSEESGIVCWPALATDAVGELPSPDLCLLCVKSYDLIKVVQAMAPRVGEETVVMPLLNGVDIYERVRTVLQGGVVLKAAAYVGTHIERAGVVTQRGAEGIILAGPDPRRTGFDYGGVIRLFDEAGIKLTWLDDPDRAIWEKYLFISSYGLVTAAEGKTLGEVYGDEALRRTVREIMKEILSIGRGKGVTLPDSVLEEALGKAGRFPPETKTSYQRDVEAGGPSDEGDLFGGTIVRYGEALGIPTPFTRAVYMRIRGAKGGVASG